MSALNQTMISSIWMLPFLMVVVGTGSYVMLTYAVGVVRRADLTALIYLARNRGAKRGVDGWPVKNRALRHGTPAANPRQS